MKINKIQITAFGKLKNFELCVNDGLNLIYGDNEAGKSTLMTFIKMALYGSTVRGSSLDNPRVKYLPFDGSQMSGVLYFNHDHINYRLDCKFGATPAKDKIALFNDDTGEIINLGADQTVGEYFFELSNTTFESTSFIQSIAPSGGADEIVKLLSAAGGTDDGTSPELVKKRLTAAKDSQFTKRRVGAGDKLCERLEQKKRELLMEKERAKVLKDTKQNIEYKQAEIERLTNRKKQLLQIIDAAADMRRRSQLEEFKEVCALKSGLEAACGGITAEFVEEVKKKHWHYEQQKAGAASAEQAAAAALKKAGADSAQQAAALLEDATKKQQDLTDAPTKHINKGPLIFGLILILLGVCAGIILHPAAFGLGVVGLVLTLLCFAKKSNTVDTEQLGAKYQLIIEKAQNALELSKQSQIAQAKCADAQNMLLCELKKLDEGASLEDAQQVILSTTKMLTLLQDIKSRYLALSQALAVTPEQAVKELESLPKSELAEQPSKYAYDELSTIEKTLPELIGAVAALNERLSSFGSRKGAAEIEREIDKLEQELSLRTRFAEAADLANAVLADAYSELRQSFGPQLNQKTAELFEKLTDGRYNQIKVAHDLSLTAGEQGSFDLIDADYLSAGTADQAYIALRLAIASLLANGTLPVFLDDAFLQFDAKREGAAFKLLAELSKLQQFIFFTCKNDTAERARQVNANIINMQ